MKKPAICILVCENKDADQLRGNREADQRLCFRYTDSTTPFFSQRGLLIESHHEKTVLHMQAQISCAVTAQLISAYDFAT